MILKVSFEKVDRSSSIIIRKPILKINGIRSKFNDHSRPEIKQSNCSNTVATKIYRKKPRSCGKTTSGVTKQRMLVQCCREKKRLS